MIIDIGLLNRLSKDLEIDLEFSLREESNFDFTWLNISRSELKGNNYFYVTNDRPNKFLDIPSFYLDRVFGGVGTSVLKLVCLCIAEQGGRGVCLKRISSNITNAITYEGKNVTINRDDRFSIFDSIGKKLKRDYCIKNHFLDKSNDRVIYYL